VAGRARWRQADAAEAAGVVRGEALRLTEDVERTLFAPATDEHRHAGRWARLWQALRELYIARVTGRG
jgi:hypothetical protein